MTLREPFIQGSVDYLDVPVTNRLGTDLTDDLPVAISIDDQETWLTAEWLGTEGPTREASVLLNTTALARSEYAVLVRVTTTPAIPIIVAGTIQVV